jgi:hypothetical protein
MLVEVEQVLITIILQYLVVSLEDLVVVVMVDQHLPHLLVTLEHMLLAEVGAGELVEVLLVLQEAATVVQVS